MSYVPHTEAERRAMLDVIRAGSVDELFEVIPPSLRPKTHELFDGARPSERPRSFDLPPGQSELAVRRELRALARRNATDLIAFVGGGFYDHFIPAAVDALAGRAEFYTAYTPYQAEMSQGILQAMYEYQSAVCRLTAMEVANASLYDGGTSLYEAMMMAIRLTGRPKVVIDACVSPIYRRMMECYTQNLDIEMDTVAPDVNRTNRERLRALLDDRAAAVILQNPNFFGTVEDLSDLVDAAHDVGALAIASVYPISLGLLTPPGRMGFDIVTGEGQSVGLPLSFGGPYLGFMACRKEHVRKMPGRIIGATHDTEGRRGFVMTLQTREQHIRREKATSNICSNEALCAVRAIIYLSLLGRHGLRRVATMCAASARYARRRLTAIPGVELLSDAPTFNEFALRLPVTNAAEVVTQLIEKGIAAGFPLGRYYPDLRDCLLVAVTEKRTKEEIGHLAEALEAVL
ncbi:MAG: aminomethyl-transferring glycine dehydrogenase subunit GcvPA [Planctomycetota bacterium]